jgi:hypothetical protein
MSQNSISENAIENVSWVNRSREKQIYEIHVLPDAKSRLVLGFRESPSNSNPECAELVPKKTGYFMKD